VTLNVQLFFGATDPLQVLVCAKSLALVPVNPTAEIVIVLFPLRLVMVTVCGALVVPTACEAKVRLVGANSAAVPVPLIATVCVPPGALSVIVNVAVRPFMAWGVKVTEMVQLALPERLVPSSARWSF
jgi:hypothetical protein